MINDEMINILFQILFSSLKVYSCNVVVIFCLRIAIFQLVTRYLHNIQQVCLKNLHLFGLETFEQTTQIQQTEQEQQAAGSKLADSVLWIAKRFLVWNPFLLILAWIDSISWVNILASIEMFIQVESKEWSEEWGVSSEDLWQQNEKLIICLKVTVGCRNNNVYNYSQWSKDTL